MCERFFNIFIQFSFIKLEFDFRFYGRIATNSCDHDQKTLDAIKANISGLGRISGERIWMEMKKIFLLNMRGDLVQTLLECGASEYIGELILEKKFIVLGSGHSEIGMIVRVLEA